MPKNDQIWHLNEGMETGFGFVHAVKSNGYLHMSGAISVNENVEVVGARDMVAQVEQVYAHIGATLKAHGLGPGDMVKETMFTTDMAALLAANDKRKAFYDGVTPPAATAVGVTALAVEGCMIEIEGIAELK